MKTWQENSGNSLTPEICADCGRPFDTIFLPLARKWVHATCPCVLEKYEREEKERLAKEKRVHIKRLFNHSGLTSRFARCSFENWVKRPGTEKAFAAALRYARDLEQNIQAGRGLIIFGPPGNGKSHLAAAITAEALSSGKTAIFERVPRLLSRIRSTYENSPGVTEAQLLHTLGQVELLVLDDAGAEKWTQWTEPMLYTIIDERYSWERSLIITTNAKLTELKDKVGDRAMDRLLEMCEIEENTGTSYRKEKAHPGNRSAQKR